MPAPAVPAMSATSKSPGVRGSSWREKETLDLLEIWGTDNVQDALAAFHKNTDVFEDISNQMHELGHQRSAEECRTKSKALRQEYRRVITHNSRSGNSPARCPHFEILDRILRKDRSARVRELKKSFKMRFYKPKKSNKENLPQPGSEEQFNSDLVTINSNELRTSTPLPTSSAMVSCRGGPADTQEPGLDPTASTIPISAQFGSTTSWVRSEAESDEENELVQPQQTLEGADPVHDGAVPPHDKEAQVEGEQIRQRRVALLNEVAIQMMEQGKSEHMETMQRLDGWLQMEDRKFHAIMEEGERDRRALEVANQKNVDVLMAAVNAIRDLGQLFSGMRSPPVANEQPCTCSPVPERGTTSKKGWCAAKCMQHAGVPHAAPEVLVEDTPQESQSLLCSNITGADDTRPGGRAPKRACVGRERVFFEP